MYNAGITFYFCHNILLTIHYAKAYVKKFPFCITLYKRTFQIYIYIYIYIYVIYICYFRPETCNGF